MEPIIGAPPADAPGELIKDADTDSFEKDVMVASQETPVIVDFWAPWCGPCKQITPLLEKAVRAAGGKVKLVKVNIDENPQIAQAFRVQSIPAVHAVVGGQPVDGFVGAVPESQIKSFIERLVGEVGPTPVEQALERAAAALENGDHGAASALFAQVINHEPDNPDAIAGLARCHIEAGDLAGAHALLDGLDEAQANHPAITGAGSALAIAEQAAASAGTSDDRATLEARLAANADDHQARFDLAMAHYSANEREASVDQLLEIVRRDAAWNDAAARSQLVTLFEAFGQTDPLTIAARRRLSSILFA